MTKTHLAYELPSPRPVRADDSARPAHHPDRARPTPAGDTWDFARGATPLQPRLEPWQRQLFGAGSHLDSMIEDHGSPINLHNPHLLLRNAERLRAVATKHDVPLEIFFARKANKCLSYVFAAQVGTLGIDTASEQEASQVLEAGVDPARIICTAAIKTTPLLDLCALHGITVALDNTDEIERLAEAARLRKVVAPVALRVSGFSVPAALTPSQRISGRPVPHQKLFSRFGFDVDDVLGVVHRLWTHPHIAEALRIEGLHFHLDGYDPTHRVHAIHQCLPIIDELRHMRHPISFLDMGGGLPMSYLESQTQWRSFWTQLEAAQLGVGESITYRNNDLGLGAKNRGDTIDRAAVNSSSPQQAPHLDLTAANGASQDRPSHRRPTHETVPDAGSNARTKGNVYPFWQEPTAADWLDQVLGARLPESTTSIADRLRGRDITLRCEPGRSLLDGCGFTVARVEFCKQHPDGHALIGLAMNRTQCRTSSEDFLVDPIHIPKRCAGRRSSSCQIRPLGESVDERRNQPVEGYLVGAYCIEDELLTWRRLTFECGVVPGDLIVFPNTAGYFMHFLESRSHQFPLARNLVRAAGGESFLQDPIDD